jgi:hypothetical protein
MALTDLVRMLNQIAANFSYEEPSRAAQEVASHLRSFWTPQMREEILEHGHENPGDLSDVAKLALGQLAALS